MRVVENPQIKAEYNLNNGKNESYKQEKLGNALALEMNLI